MNLARLVGAVMWKGAIFLYGVSILILGFALLNGKMISILPFYQWATPTTTWTLPALYGVKMRKVNEFLPRVKPMVMFWLEVICAWFSFSWKMLILESFIMMLLGRIQQKHWLMAVANISLSSSELLNFVVKNLKRIMMQQIGLCNIQLIFK